MRRRVGLRQLEPPGDDIRNETPFQELIAAIQSNVDNSAIDDITVNSASIDSSGGEDCDLRNVYTAGTVQTDASSYTFSERDFLLPDLDAVNMGNDLKSINLYKKLVRKEKQMKNAIQKEKDFFVVLDRLSNKPDEGFGHPGLHESVTTLRNRRLRAETNAELGLVRHVITRQPGDYAFQLGIAMEATLACARGDYEEESTADNPKLDSVQEKMADLQQEEMENWCKSRGLKCTERYTNKEKRMLRKWFKELDTGTLRMH